jgi:hypothetical protein
VGDLGNPHYGYKKECTRLTVTGDKVYQLLAHGRWFSPGTPASFTTKTGLHDIAELLLKVALNTKNQKKQTEILTIDGTRAQIPTLSEMMR